MNGLLLVALIPAAVGLIQAAIWIPLLRSWRRQSDAFPADLRREAAASGERFIIC